MKDDPYAVLGVRFDASFDEVRSAYLEMARIHHPDASGGSKERMQSINDAWAVLGSADARRTYDSSHRVDPPRPEPDWEPAGADYDVGTDDAAGSPVVGVARAVIAFAPVCFVVGLLIFGLGVVLQVAPIVQTGLLVLLFSIVAFLMAPFLAMGASINRASVDGSEQDDDAGDL